MNSTHQDFQIPNLGNLSLGEQFHIPSLNFPNSSDNSSSPSLSALASEHLTQNSSNLLNFDLSVGSKTEEKTLSLADIANLHLSSTDSDQGAFQIPSLSGAEANKVTVPNLQFNLSEPAQDIDLSLALGKYNFIEVITYTMIKPTKKVQGNIDS